MHSWVAWKANYHELMRSNSVTSHIAGNLGCARGRTVWEHATSATRPAASRSGAPPVHNFFIHVRAGTGHKKSMILCKLLRIGIPTLILLVGTCL